MAEAALSRLGDAVSSVASATTAVADAQRELAESSPGTRDEAREALRLSRESLARAKDERDRASRRADRLYYDGWEGLVAEASDAISRVQALAAAVNQRGVEAGHALEAGDARAEEEARRLLDQAERDLASALLALAQDIFLLEVIARLLDDKPEPEPKPATPAPPEDGKPPGPPFRVAFGLPWDCSEAAVLPAAECNVPPCPPAAADEECVCEILVTSTPGKGATPTGGPPGPGEEAPVGPPDGAAIGGPAGDDGDAVPVTPPDGAVPPAEPGVVSPHRPPVIEGKLKYVPLGDGGLIVLGYMAEKDSADAYYVPAALLPYMRMNGSPASFTMEHFEAMLDGWVEDLTASGGLALEDRDRARAWVRSLFVLKADEAAAMYRAARAKIMAAETRAAAKRQRARAAGDKTSEFLLEFDAEQQADIDALAGRVTNRSGMTTREIAAHRVVAQFATVGRRLNPTLSERLEDARSEVSGAVAQYAGAVTAAGLVAVPAVSAALAGKGLSTVIPLLGRSVAQTWAEQKIAEGVGEIAEAAIGQPATEQGKRFVFWVTTAVTAYEILRGKATVAGWEKGRGTSSAPGNRGTVRTGPGTAGSARRTGVPDGTESWSNKPGKLTSAENAAGHATDHASEFGMTKGEYIDAANKFVSKPPKGAEVFVRESGETMIYDPATNTFAVRTPEGVPATFMKPRPGYWQDQLDLYGGARAPGPR